LESCTCINQKTCKTRGLVRGQFGSFRVLGVNGGKCSSQRLLVTPVERHVEGVGNLLKGHHGSW
jgi:hypothetical protein